MELNVVEDPLTLIVYVLQKMLLLKTHNQQILLNVSGIRFLIKIIMCVLILHPSQMEQLEHINVV